MWMVAWLSTFMLVCLMQIVCLHAIDALFLPVVTSYSHGNVQDLHMLPYGQSRCMQVLIGSKVCANAGCCLLYGAPALQ